METELSARSNSTQPFAIVHLAFKAMLTSPALKLAAEAMMIVVTEKSVTTCLDPIRERSASLFVQGTLVLRVLHAQPQTIEKLALVTILFRAMAIQLAMSVRFHP